MITLLLLVAVLLVGLLLLIGSGVGIGLTLHWLVPAIDPGMSVLIGVVALAFTVQMVSRLLMLLPPLEVEEGGEEAQEERPRDIVYVVEEISGRSKRRGRKGSR